MINGFEVIHTNDDNIAILKKNNHIKIASKFKMNDTNILFDMIKKKEIFKRIYKTNQDVVKEYHISEDSNKVIYVFHDELEINGGNLDYICLKIKINNIDHNNILVEGIKDKKFVNLDSSYNKMELEDLSISIKNNKGTFIFETNFHYNVDKIPAFLAKKLAKIIGKLISRFCRHLSTL